MMVGTRGPVGFKNGKLVPEEIFPFVLADQSYWQTLMLGQPVLQTKLGYHSQGEEISLPELCERATLIFARGSSHSVLVPASRQAPKLRQYFPLPPESTWCTLVEAQHPLDYWGFGAVWLDQVHGATFCAYGMGVSFIDKTGTLHDNQSIVEPELLSLLGKLRLRKLGR